MKSLSWFQVISVATILLFASNITTSQESRAAAGGLEKYASTSKQITELDWNLLQVNLLWHDSYREAEYVKSSPIWFDYQTMEFNARLRVAEKRGYNDPDEFSSLPAFKRKAILQEVVDYMETLLKPKFPRTDNIGRHLRVAFVYVETGGGSSTIATYRHGQLKLEDK